MTRWQPCIVCSVIVVTRDHNPLGVTEQRTDCDCQKSQSRQQYPANQQWNKTPRIASKHSRVEGEQLLSVDHSLYFNTTRNYNHLQKWFIISHVNFHRYLKTLRRPGAPIWAFIDNDFPEWNIRAAPGPWSVDRRPAGPSVHPSHHSSRSPPVLIDCWQVVYSISSLEGARGNRGAFRLKLKFTAGVGKWARTEKPL